MIDSQTILAVAKFIIQSLQQNTFSRQADNEIAAAKIICDTINEEESRRDGLNRVLCHLESAYMAYSECVKTIDILDHESIIYRKAGKPNMICESIAAIHYDMGNIEVARTWLLNYMRSDGEYNRSIHFYKAILGEDFRSFEDNILSISDKHFDSIRSTREMVIERESGWGPGML